MNIRRTNTILLVLLVIISLSFCATLLLRKKGQQSKVDQASSVKTLETVQNEIKASFYNIYPTLVVTSEDFVINDSLSVTGKDRKQHLLKDLVGVKSKLILRYSQLDCGACVDTVMANVQRIIGKSKMAKDLILISDFRSERDFLIFEKYKKHKYPVYNISQKTLGLPIENKNFPFLFIITKDLHVTRIFVPFRDLQKQTSEYLNYAFDFLEHDS